jgi:hypothetical protein
MTTQTQYLRPAGRITPLMIAVVTLYTLGFMALVILFP